MPMLTRVQIDEAKDLPKEKAPVPEWAPQGTPKKERADFYVNVKTMTGLERDRYEAGMIERQDDGPGGKKKVKINLENVRAKLLWRTIVDDEGKTIYKESEIAQLGLKSAAVLDRLWTIARRLNGLSQEDVDFYVGNSDAEPSDSSPSA